jgi:uncharacterized protein with FMN-binding domain
MNNKAIPISIVALLVIGVTIALGSRPAPEQTNTNNETATNTTGNPVVVGEPTPTTNGNGTATGTTGDATQSQFQDGTYSATANYTSPAGSESIGVTLTVTGDIITAVSIDKLAENPRSQDYQTLFSEGISGAVVGKKLDEAQVSKVNGSSLTPGGFNNAVDQINLQAAI